jgi:CO/xanthine dehydrogenase FAD-binding subunit
VENDHPAFTITILTKQNKTLLEDIAIVITGHTKRFMRAEAIESQLKGKNPAQVDLKGIAKGMNLKFPSVRGMSAEYLRHLAGTQIERGLQELLKS